MRRPAPTLIALVAVVGGCAPMHGRDKGLAASGTSEDLLEQALDSRRFAVLVGVDDYQDPTFPDLRWASKDAEDLGAQLRTAEGGGWNVTVLDQGADTGREGVREALFDLKQRVRPNDQVVVYFSGHGTRIWDDEHQKWRRFLLLSDSHASDLASTAIDLESLQTFFESIPAVRKSLIVDACFSGDGKSVVRADTLGQDGAHGSDVDPLVSRLFTMGAGESQLFATTAGRPSREDDKLQHGVYTYYLLDALRFGFQDADKDHDGVLTAWEAHDYARDKVMKFTDGVQIPEAAFRVIGESDLVLAGDEKHRRAREVAMVYLPAASQSPLASTRLSVDGRDRGPVVEAAPIEPGRHRVELTSADGSSVVDGYYTFKPGVSYRADDLSRVVQGPGHMVGVRPAFVRSAPLAAQLGDGGYGVEGWLVHRVNRGPARGLFEELVLGGAFSPNRVVAGLPTPASRPVLWTSLSAGMQNDFHRLRWRAGIGATGVVVPPDWLIEYQGHPDPKAVPSEAGWWLVGGGPTVGVGYVLSGGWTLMAEGREHFAWLDVAGDGTPEAVPFTSVGLGIEVAW